MIYSSWYQASESSNIFLKKYPITQENIKPEVWEGIKDKHLKDYTNPRFYTNIDGVSFITAEKDLKKYLLVFKYGVLKIAEIEYKKNILDIRVTSIWVFIKFDDFKHAFINKYYTVSDIISFKKIKKVLDSSLFYYLYVDSYNKLIFRGVDKFRTGEIEVANIEDIKDIKINSKTSLKIIYKDLRREYIILSERLSEKYVRVNAEEGNFIGTDPNSYYTYCDYYIAKKNGEACTLTTMKENYAITINSKPSRGRLIELFYNYTIEIDDNKILYVDTFFSEPGQYKFKEFDLKKIDENININNLEFKETSLAPSYSQTSFFVFYNKKPILIVYLGNYIDIENLTRDTSVYRAAGFFEEGYYLSNGRDLSVSKNSEKKSSNVSLYDNDNILYSESNSISLMDVPGWNVPVVGQYLSPNLSFKTGGLKSLYDYLTGFGLVSHSIFSSEVKKTGLIVRRSSVLEVIDLNKKNRSIYLNSFIDLLEDVYDNVFIILTENKTYLYKKNETVETISGDVLSKEGKRFSSRYILNGDGTSFRVFYNNKNIFCIRSTGEIIRFSSSFEIYYCFSESDKFIFFSKKLLNSTPCLYKIHNTGLEEISLSSSNSSIILPSSSDSIDNCIVAESSILAGFGFYLLVKFSRSPNKVSLINRDGKIISQISFNESLGLTKGYASLGDPDTFFIDSSSSSIFFATQENLTKINVSFSLSGDNIPLNIYRKNIFYNENSKNFFTIDTKNKTVKNIKSYPNKVKLLLDYLELSYTGRAFITDNNKIGWIDSNSIIKDFRTSDTPHNEADDVVYQLSPKLVLVAIKKTTSCRIYDFKRNKLTTLEGINRAIRTVYLYKSLKRAFIVINFSDDFNDSIMFEYNLENDTIKEPVPVDKNLYITSYNLLEGEYLFLGRKISDDYTQINYIDYYSDRIKYFWSRSDTDNSTIFVNTLLSKTKNLATLLVSKFDGETKEIKYFEKAKNFTAYSTLLLRNYGSQFNGFKPNRIEITDEKVVGNYIVFYISFKYISTEDQICRTIIGAKIKIPRGKYSSSLSFEIITKFNNVPLNSMFISDTEVDTKSNEIIRKENNNWVRKKILKGNYTDISETEFIDVEAI